MLEAVDIGRLLFLGVIAIGIVLPVRLWVLEPIYIATGSMEPTLPTGRHLFTDKLTLRTRGIRAGDIIVFRPPVGKLDEEMVKRVIAVGGQSVELREKKVFVDGQERHEPYAVHKRGGEQLQGDSLGPLTVPKGSLFVLGDNRDESDDSTVWKDEDGNPVYFVDETAVKGLVRGIY